jgi:hypothetical protein
MISCYYFIYILVMFFYIFEISYYDCNLKNTIDMKNIIIALFIGIIGFVNCNAATNSGLTVTVDLTTAGTLSSVLRNQGTDFTQITKIVVTGKLNNKDLNTISTSMPIVTSIDISGTNATVVPDDMFKGKSQIQEFVAPATMRKIGNSAFESCNLLKTLPFSSQVDTIGNSAFINCGSLNANILFPSTLKFIGNNAFFNCYSLTGVNLSASTSLSSLNGGTFYGCTSIKSVLFPSSLTYLNWGEFNYCTYLTSIDLSMCKSMQSLNNDIFAYCTSLKTIKLPSSITNIGTVFSGCAAIRSISVMSKTPPQIASSTFASIPYAYCNLIVPIGTEEAYMNASYWEYFDLIAGQGILPQIGANGSLKANGKTLKDGEIYFHEGNLVQLVPIPAPGYVVDQLTINGNSVSNLESIVIPAGTVGARVNISFKLKKFKLRISIQGNGFIKYGGQRIDSTSILELDSASFAQFILKPNAENVVDSLFFNDQLCIVQKDSIFNSPQICSNSTMSVRFVSASSIGDVCKVSVSTGSNGYVKFMNTPLLAETNITVKKGQAASIYIIPDATYRIEKVMFNGLNVTNQVINHVFTTDALNANAFLLISFSINPIVTVTVNESGTLSLLLTKGQCKELTTLKVNGRINGYDFMFIRDSIKALTTLNLTDATVVEVPGSASWIDNAIPENALTNHTALMQVLLPTGIKFINFAAFKNCSKLSSINLQDCGSLQQIGSQAFYGCSSITTFHLPASLNRIDYNGFSVCSSLASIILDGMTPPSLDPNAFDGSNVLLINVPSASLAAYKMATIWKNYLIIGSGASSLTVNVQTPGTLSAAITAQGANVSEVTKLVVTGTINSEDFRVMNKIMTQLYSVDLSQTTITSIPYGAFEGKIQLMEFKAPSAILNIGDKAFSGCRLLKEIPFGNQIQTIGNNAFELCSSLDGNIVFPQNFNSLGSYAFSGCGSLDTVDMSKCKFLTQIPSYAFYGCSNLKSVTFPTTINYIYDYAFSNCNLSKVDLTNISQLYYLNGGAFQSNSFLFEVVLPATIQFFGSYIFSSCQNLSVVKIFSTYPPNISSDLFSGVDMNTCILYVPTGALTNFKLASNWSSFANIKEIGIKLIVGNNGKVMVSGTEMKNNQVLFHNESMVELVVKPNTGYEVDVMKFNQTPLTKVGDSYLIPAGITSGTFEITFKLKKYALTVTVDSCGTLKYNQILVSDTTISLTVDSASSVKFIVLPKAGFVADKIQFNDLINVTQKGDSIYNTPMLSGASSLMVHFITNSNLGIRNKLDVISGANGQLEYMNTPMLPTTDVSINYGERAEFTIKPNANYLINKVLYNGVDMTVNVINNKFAIESVTASGLLDISFRVNPVSSVNVVTPGSLSLLLSTDQIKGVTNLILTGKLNEQDIYFMRDYMEVLSVLNMRMATFEYHLFMEFYSPNIISYAFNNNGVGKKTLTEVYLPLNTPGIENNAFSDCTNLRYVNFEECTKLTSISNNAFQNTALKNIIMPASLNNLSAYTFSNNVNLTSIDLYATSLTTIPNYCFYSCSKLVTLILPKTINKIENCAFQSCSAVKSIDLKGINALTTIGSAAFSSCYALQSIIFPASLKTLGEGAFQSSYNLKSVDLSCCTNLLSIEQSTFNSCNSLTSVKLPSVLKTIGTNAFWGCNIVGTIELPGSVTTIGNDAFNYNMHLSFCKIDAVTPPVLGSNVFPMTMAAVFVPAQSVTMYEASEFWKDYEIVGGQKEITVNVTQPGTLATCIMDQTGIAPREVTKMTVTGNLNAVDFENIRSNMQLLSTLDLSRTIVTVIPEGAFKNKMILMNFIAPANLTEIKPNAFDNCSNLSGTLIIPEKVTTIGSSAFSNCVSLSGIKLPNSLVNINDNAFYNCCSLDQVLQLPATLKTIGYNAFSGCTSLKDTLIFPKGITSIGSQAFSNCTALSCIDLTACSNLQSISSYEFSNCTSLSTVRFSNALEYLYDNAFSNCINLMNITFPSSLSGISSSAFSNCTALKLVDLSSCKSLVSIGDETFYNCTSLVTINLSPVLTSIGARAFANNTSLANISSMNEAPAILGDNTFYKVRTKKCVLSIPKSAYYTYLNASQWGSFVQMSKQVDVEISDGGTISFESIVPDSSGTTLRSASTLNVSIGANLKSGARICVLDNQALKFNLVPDAGAIINKVMYNNLDVTNTVVDGVFLTPSVTTNVGTLMVTFTKNATPLHINKYGETTTKVINTSESIFVENANGLKGLEIFTISGQRVYKSTEPNTNYGINNLTAGLYIIRAFLVNDSIETVKVVRK